MPETTPQNPGFPGFLWREYISHLCSLLGGNREKTVKDINPMYGANRKNGENGKSSFEPGWEISSAVERAVHIGEVTGSKPVFPTSTTHKGDVAEMLAAAELMRRGYRVSRPLSNGAPYDLIVDDGSRLFKVQVKKANEIGSALRVNLSASKYHRGRGRVSYSQTCDAVIGVECSQVRFYVFFGDELRSHELRLRLTPAKNNQAAGVRFASSFDMGRLFPPLQRSSR